MISLQALSNTILEKSFTEKVPVSPMKLQKLLYFIYKEYAQKTGEPLFSENFQAWDYGPVVQSIYDEFKSFKGNSITRFSKDASDKVYVLSPNKSSVVFDAINSVWDKYKDCSGIELSQITHRCESAWYKAYTSEKAWLEFEDIINDKTDNCNG